MYIYVDMVEYLGGFFMSYLKKKQKQKNSLTYWAALAQLKSKVFHCASI